MPIDFNKDYREVPLREKIKMITKEFENRKEYLSHNKELFDVYEGNLAPKVDTIMQNTVSRSYYEAVKWRLFPINILKRIIDKLAKAYHNNPIRRASSSDEVLEFYEDVFGMNKMMNIADEFSHMFKGYALEPVINEGVPSLRVLPYDRFFVIGEDFSDPLKVTIFVKVMGSFRKEGEDKDVHVLFCYSDQEFLAITDEGDILSQFMEENEGVNPFGVIPFMYANRSLYEIMPVQDTDILQLSLLLPVLFSDLGGALMFQAFSIVYGIDVDSENMEWSPNTFWSIKSDAQSDKSPEVGSISPTLKVEDSLNYITGVFTSWMESRGIKVNSLGKLGADGMASGISKAIDEMDTFEQVKKAIQHLSVEERELWRLVKVMHNKWIEMKLLVGKPTLPEDWEVITEFDEPKPLVDRREEVETMILTEEAGYVSHDTAMRKLWPDWGDDEIEEEKKKMEQEAPRMFPSVGQDEPQEG